MILVIDNYDSFTYNLVQYLGELGAKVEVCRNDAVTVTEVETMAPAGILISPGPGRPEDAGISLSLVEELGSAIPTFGVCLGHQSIAQRFGASIVRADRLMHGRTSEILHDAKGVFATLPSPLTATRYHSLIVARDTIPPELAVTAWTEDGEVMGLRHTSLPIESVQFHPESFLTQHGHQMLRNWLQSFEPEAAV
ncbi:MAG: aminodeoxychorismate/anthranilate synthase component II [Polyangiales bacterium]